MNLSLPFTQDHSSYYTHLRQGVFAGQWWPDCAAPNCLNVGYSGPVSRLADSILRRTLGDYST